VKPWAATILIMVGAFIAEIILILVLQRRRDKLGRR